MAEIWLIEYDKVELAAEGGSGGGEVQCTKSMGLPPRRNEIALSSQHLGLQTWF